MSEFVDDCQFDTDQPAFLPETYVPGSSERMLLYRELDGMQTDAQVEAYRQRLEDRFGRLPDEARGLLSIVELRRLGRQLAVERLTLKNDKLILTFVARKNSPFYDSAEFAGILRFVNQYSKQCHFDPNNDICRLVVSKVASLQKALEIMRSMKSA